MKCEVVEFFNGVVWIINAMSLLALHVKEGFSTESNKRSHRLMIYACAIVTVEHLM